MPRLIWVFGGHTLILLVLSCRGSYNNKAEGTVNIWAASWQNQQNGMCAQWRLTSAWASARSDHSLFARRKIGSLATHWTHTKDSDQTGWIPRLIWVFAGRTGILLVLSCGGSFETGHGKTYKMIVGPAKTQISGGTQAVCSLSWVTMDPNFLPSSKGWSDISDAQVDLGISFSKLWSWLIWAASWQTQQNDLCAQQRLKSAWASAQFDQSTHAQADLSLRWPHRSFC